MDANQARLLIVDDDPRYLRSVEVLLQTSNYDVDTAGSVADAIDKLASAHFDLVVLDLNMPGANGVELLSHLSGDDRNIKTIVVSGESSPESITPVLRFGANDYLVKPIPPSKLLASIGALLERKGLEDDNRRMQQRIEASDQLHRYLVNQSPDVIYMLDDRGHFTYVNSKVQDVFGCEKGALLGEHWTVLFEPEHVEKAQFVFNERRLGERATRHVELRALPPGASEPIYVEITAMGIWRSTNGGERSFFGTYGVARNVTKRRTTELALSDSQRKFFTLFESSPDAIFISRLDTGELLETNESFRHIAQALGVAPRGRDDFLWLNDTHRMVFTAGLRRTPDRFRQEVALLIHGQAQHFELAARHIVIEQYDCMLGTLRDLTVQKSGERERIALEQQLQQARKLEAIGQLAGGIAHDFNNILASMIGYTELALRPSERVTEEKRQSYLEQVISAGQRARDLIAQLLSFSRTNRENANQVDLGNEIQQAMRMMRAAIPTTIDIDCSAADRQLPAVLIDPVHLQQVLINLFVNARDAIDGIGRIDIGVHAGPVHDTCASCHATFEGEWVGFEVRDTGRGIDQTLLPRIFDRFVTSRESGQGTGIGLAVVHSIVHEYGGHLVVESAPGRGTRFRILLPPADADRPVTQPTPRLGAVIDDAQGHGRVLVVDDEASVGNMIAESLRSAGFEVLLYSDASDALARIERNPDDLDLIITDQTMPRMSGLELCTRVKALPQVIPVVLVTGYQDTARAKAIGVDHVLPKPFSVVDLLRIARELTSGVQADAGFDGLPAYPPELAPDHRLDQSGF